MMKKWIPVLSALLAAQLVLAVVVNLAGEDYEAFEAEEKLLVFDKQAVDGLRIEDGESSIMLEKRDGKWLLPASGDFPATAGSVDRLLDKLSAMQKGWPVATTVGAARRFKVAEEEFERKLTLFSNKKPLAELYVGTSPGFRKVHARPAGEDAVFAVAFNTWDANAKADDWIDKGILSLGGDDVDRVEMADFVLQREGDALNLGDLGADEQTNAVEARSLIGKLTGLRIQSVLGSDPKPEYRQDEPVLEARLVRKGGEELTYRFSKPQEGAYYVLTRSDLDYFFKVPQFAVNPIKDVTREKLVESKTGDMPSTGAAGEHGDVIEPDRVEQKN